MKVNYLHIRSTMLVFHSQSGTKSGTNPCPHGPAKTTGHFCQSIAATPWWHQHVCLLLKLGTKDNVGCDTKIAMKTITVSGPYQAWTLFMTEGVCVVLSGLQIDKLLPRIGQSSAELRRLHLGDTHNGAAKEQQLWQRDCHLTSSSN